MTNKPDTTNLQQSFVNCMEEFIFQIKDDTLREEMEAALTHLRGIFASEAQNGAN